MSQKLVKSFVDIFAWWWKDPDPYLRWADPEPGGAKKQDTAGPVPDPEHCLKCTPRRKGVQKAFPKVETGSYAYGIDDVYHHYRV